MLKINKLKFATLCLISSQAVFADDDLRGELLRCADLDNDSVRLACYDKLGGHEIAVLATDNLPAEVSAPAAAPPEDFGAEKLRNRPEEKEKEQEKEESATVPARVTRCVKDSRKKYHFYLEGGQVWKQVSDKKLFLKECDFNVTISKDFFGYKMQIEGEKSKTRVSRIR